MTHSPFLLPASCVLSVADPEAMLQYHAGLTRQILAANDLALPEKEVPRLTAALMEALFLLLRASIRSHSGQATYEFFEAMLLFCTDAPEDASDVSP